MPRKRHNGRLGTTAGCVRRLLEHALRFETKEPSPAQEDLDIGENGENKDELDWLSFDDIDDALQHARLHRVAPAPPGTQQDSSGPAEQTVS